MHGWPGIRVVGQLRQAGTDLRGGFGTTHQAYDVSGILGSDPVRTITLIVKTVI